MINFFNPNIGTNIQLLDGSAVKYETAIPVATGVDQVEQRFTIENVEPGMYTLVVTKPAHTSFTIQDIVVTDEDIDLTQDDREEIKLITLTVGDIDGNGQIDKRDLSILRNNIGKTGEDIDEPLADLNGDGQVDVRDLSLLLDGFGKSCVVISW
jgi:hypothetical protein